MGQFAFDVGLLTAKNQNQSKIKGVGQECPTHTTLTQGRGCTGQGIGNSFRSWHTALSEIFATSAASPKLRHGFLQERSHVIILRLAGRLREY